ncbi:MCE family protein [Aeromicrobium sp. A1-2]|uniref:MCE family protein n=1 Tax=Aeromicrobium sp. A1-2 TaxID=2107713 RepID=UPI000E545268|nr:MCE family protein [Aeromicrobium sp. A1-2]AXT83987.1 MCE family protein [Aeromicrobium sp. A1-2]
MSVLRRHPGEVIGILLFAAVSILLTSMVGNTLAQQSSGAKRQYVAEFVDSSGIKPGDEVRIAGVHVGRIEGRELHDGLARVYFSVAADQSVRSDTIVRVSYLNLLGQRYLALEAGAQPGARLPEGSVIGTDHTRAALDLTALFNAFKPLFDALDPDDVNLLATEVVKSLQGEGSTLRHLTAQTADLTSHLAERDEVISRVVDNVTTVMASASDHREDLSNIITSLHSLVGRLADDSDDIDASLRSMDGLTAALGGMLDDTADPLTADLAKMTELGGTLVRHDGELGQALEDAPNLLAGYARSMSYGSWLNTYVCTLKIAIKGVTTFDGDSPPHSKVCR